MHPDDDTQGRPLAITVCVLAALGVIITIAANLDRSSWGAALVVGMLGSIAGIILGILGLVAYFRATRGSVKTIAGIGIALAAVGIISALALLN